LFRLNENTFKSIASTFKSYKNALSNDKDAHSLFTSGIVSKCKKLAAAKPEQEVTINEWISQIQNLSRDKLVVEESSKEEEEEEETTMMTKDKTKGMTSQDENSSLLNVMVSN
jgi:ribosomal 50S subunit-recycling heat shock protein